MKSLHCTHCQMTVFFENDHCLKCGHSLGFVTDVMDMQALEPAKDGLWQPVGNANAGKLYRQCANGRQQGLCNWLVPADDTNAWCVACRLNEIIPDLSDPKNLKRWSSLEIAKRR